MISVLQSLMGNQFNRIIKSFREDEFEISNLLAVGTLFSLTHVCDGDGI